VVFSDATLDNFEKHDLESYRRITQEFAYWDDIAIHFKGSVHRIGGNGFCGCSRRALLLILQDRARELGVKLVFQADVDDEARLADCDLVVVADGVNSRFRDKHAEHFRTEVDVRPNKFTGWARRVRSTPSRSSSRTPSGARSSPTPTYTSGRSTWVFETDPQTFERAASAQ
jgi:anthraniloyl-CoA monooxygenase